MPSVFLSFVDRDPALFGFLPTRAASPAELLERGQARIAYARAETMRPALVANLRDHAQRFEAPAAVFEALDRLSRPGTMAIVTGQQPGLFGGPMYIWHKAATALRLAREIRAQPGAPDVVTVFWNHSDDHDWGEANHSFLVNSGLDVQRVRLHMPVTGRPLFDLPVGASVSAALDEARDLLPVGPAAEAQLELLRPRSESDTLPALLTRALYSALGDEGLIVLDPACLEPELRLPLLAFHERASELRTEFQSTAAELQDRGHALTIDPETSFLFQVREGARRSGVPDGSSIEPGYLPSPGVLFRNLWQDSLLPTLAFVGGPGEIGYLAVSGRLYESLEIPLPAIVPRASMTLADERLLEGLDRWNLTLADLELGPTAIESKIVQCEGSETPEAADVASVPEDRLRQLGEDFERRLRELEAEVSEVDPHLLHPLGRLALRTKDELDKLATKLDRQRKNLSGAFRQHARRLCVELRPRGRMQERVFPGLPFFVRHGPDLSTRLIEVADPFATGHLLVAPDRD